MNTILSATPVLGIFNMELGSLIPIVAIIAPFVMIISIQVAKSIARTQQERMRCEVIRTAIERGQPIPADVFKPLPTEDEAEFLAQANRPATPQFDIRTGLICVGAGLGLYLMFATFEVGGFDGLRGLRWIGAIPGFVGVALIVNGLINRPSAAASTAANTRSGGPRDDFRS